MKQKQFAAFFLALVLAFSMLSLTALADAAPTITVVGNDSAPVAPGGETTFQVQLTNFEGVKGMDVTITGTAGVVFKSITSDDITLTRDDNYTLSANKIQLVDLNGKASLTLTVTATVNADADIAVTAQLAASATQLVENVSIVNGKLTMAPLTRALGAQLRAGEAPYALRFIVETQCAGAAYKTDGGYEVDYSAATVTVNGTARTVARIGAVVARADKATAEELVAGANTNYIKDVEAKKAYDVAAGTVQYAVTVVNIPEKAAGTAVNIRPYVAYYDGEGAVQYIYGAILTRSVQDVLTAAA